MLNSLTIPRFLADVNCDISQSRKSLRDGKDGKEPRRTGEEILKGYGVGDSVGT